MHVHFRVKKLIQRYIMGISFDNLIIVHFLTELLISIHQLPLTSPVEIHLNSLHSIRVCCLNFRYFVCMNKYVIERSCLINYIL